MFGLKYVNIFLNFFYYFFNFWGIDFLNLRNITPEHVPRVRHPEDTSNFDTFEVCRADEEDNEVNEINDVNEDNNFKQTTAISPSNALRENGKKHTSQSKNCSNVQQQLPPNFIDFTFRHFFSDGIGGSTSGILYFHKYYSTTCFFYLHYRKVSIFKALSECLKRFPEYVHHIFRNVYKTFFALFRNILQKLKHFCKN